MKVSPDTQINAFFIDILRIQWLVFFYYGRLSSAKLDRWQARSNGLHVDQGNVEKTVSHT